MVREREREGGKVEGSLGWLGHREPEPLKDGRRNCKWLVWRKEKG